MDILEQKKSLYICFGIVLKIQQCWLCSFADSYSFCRAFQILRRSIRMEAFGHYESQALFAAM